PAPIRQPWVAFYLVFFLGVLVALAVLGPRGQLYRLLLTVPAGGLALGFSAYLTRGEGSRPGPTPRPFVGLLLAVGLLLFLLLRPDGFLPLPPSKLRDGLVHLGMWLVVPVGALLLMRVPWGQLGTAQLLRVPGRFRSLLSLLVVWLTLPAIADPQTFRSLLEAPWWKVALALPIAYSGALLGEALPEEFFFRQLLQPRLQAYFRRPTPAIVLQALLYGLAHAGSLLSGGAPWLALGAAVLEGSVFGLLYGLLRDRTGSLALPMLVHGWAATWVFLPEVLRRLPLG
ncbi:MAG: CPBP family intramembrane glutamic endopeptidase, partial [Chloroflexia bacterium]